MNSLPLVLLPLLNMSKPLRLMPWWVWFVHAKGGCATAGVRRVDPAVLCRGACNVQKPAVEAFFESRHQFDVSVTSRFCSIRCLWIVRMHGM